MRKIIGIIFLSMTIAMSAATTYQKPDFAYPKTVSKNALANVDKALAGGNGKLLVRSLINYSLAESAIDNDSLQPVLKRIEAVSAAEKQPAVKALLDIMTAEIYSSIYRNNRWSYDRRELPAGSGGDDYTLWSGNEFKEKIVSLIDRALSDPAALQAESITAYDGVIACGKESVAFYPTLYDFVAWRSIEMLRDYAPYGPLFSIAWLCRYDFYASLRFNYQSPVVKSILELYRGLLDFHRNDAAPFIITDINRIEFLNLHVYDSSDSAPAKARELLTALSERFGDSPYGAEALIAADGQRAYNDTTGTDRMYRLVTDRLKRFPGYFRNGCLENIVSTITRKQINLSYPSVIVPGDTVDITVKNSNVRSARIEVYKVPYRHDGSNMFNLRRNRAQASLVKTVSLKFDNKIPFTTETVEKITLPEAGAYIIVPVIDGKHDNANAAYDYVHCTSLAISAEVFADERWAYVTNPKTGAPVKGGVQLSLHNYNNTKPLTFTASDDNATVRIKGNGNTLYATKGNDRYAAKSYITEYPKRKSTPRYSASGFTSLSIYHPGDTVEWGAVVQRYGDIPARVVPGMKIEVLMFDVNRQKKDSLIVTTDEFGRIAGEFAIPADGLTGNYYLEFRHPDEKDRWSSYGRKSFTVSDYKLPTYSVEVTDIMRDCPAKGDVTIKGKTVTYSGFALSGCDVTAELAAVPRFGWWRGRGGDKFYSTQVTTGAGGEFSIEFPAALLAGSPIPEGIFTARLTATSPTGENRETSTSFTTGKPCVLSQSLASDIDITRPVKLAVALENVSGKPVTSEILYKIVGTDSVAVTSGSFMSDRPVIDLSGVKSGVYSIEFSTADPALADSVTAEKVVLYRPDDKASPVNDDILWVPVSSYTLTGRETAILYGTTGQEQHIHYAVYSDSVMLSQGWLTVEAGLHRFAYTLPDSVEEVRVTLATNYNYSDKSREITAVTASSIKDITLAVESFRDKITPGAGETWTFTVRDRNAKGVRSALILDMYSKALEALEPNPLNLQRGMIPASWYTIQTSIPGDISTFDAIFGKNARCVDINIPDFELWGNDWINVRVRGLRMMATSAYAGTDDANVVREHKDEIVVEEADEDKVFHAVEQYNASAPKMEAKKARADTGGMNDSAEEEAVAGEGAPEKPAEEFSYRDAETPLAFFRPTLTTDAEGNLAFSFTAPDANTTWRLQALAFTKDMLVSSLSREIIASKPVMVQPNMPRFLRTGDRATVSAAVMNNSDSTLTVNTKVELFDPFTGKVLATGSYPSAIAPGEAVTVNTDVEAAASMTAIGYRIKSATGTFADGEQSIIPILSSIAPVIDTMPFYIPVDSASFEMKLPEMPVDATVTLQFCNNPVWYVATALPGLRDEKANDALSAAAAIFSAAIAEGILNTDRNIAEAIRIWTTSDRSDSTLVSMLERNSDLKTILLNSTPWVMDAKSDTERMERLALLFDKDVIASTYDKAVRRLAMLEAGNGGWAWIGQYKEPSAWITENIVTMTGELKRLGWLPDNTRLRDMIDRGVRYLDREAAVTIKHSPEATDPSYALMRTYYPEIKPSAGAQRLINNTVAAARTDWKHYGVPEKAIAAMLLHSHNYRTAARAVIASLREYSTSTPAKGMWWASLDDMTAWSMGKVAATSLALEAFATVEPQSPDIELIRQWLILQKEAKDWGTSVSTSEAIAAILLTGRKLTEAAPAPVVKVGGTDVVPDSIDSLLGYFRRDISGMHPSGAMLEVCRQQGLPSWGAVFCRYRSEMADICPAGCDDVTIAKELFVKSVEGDRTVWNNVDTLRVGDVVQVNLTIVTKRDMDYVAVIDDRGACFEPAEQLPEPVYSEGICFYRENRDSATNIFVTHLPKGTYRLSYELYVNNAGRYSSGVASLQSQYAPALSAHSGGKILNVTWK